MHDVAKAMMERISAGLKRKSQTSCSRWACANRVMGAPFPGPWTFKTHPWLKEMHDSDAELNVGQKSAQMGYTETALNRALYLIDIRRLDCMYILPNQTPDASDFSTSRFNAALEMSPTIENLFSDVQNVGHKRSGNVSLFVRGSKSRPGLKSIPVAGIFLDEVDEMEQKNIPLALARADGQVERYTWALSTPTRPNFGINEMYLKTTQEHFFFTCPRCSRLTELIFPQCLEITGDNINDPKLQNSFFKCKECEGKLDHETKSEWLATGRWVPSYSDRDSRGFHVNQLYSMAKAGEPAALAEWYLNSLRDIEVEQEFYNSKLGLAHIVEGAGINDGDIDNCIATYKSYQKPPSDSSVLTMGVDVGRFLHWEVDQWFVPGGRISTDLNVQSQCRIIAFGKCRDFEELDVLMRQFWIRFCVIDANPERRKAYEFASRFFGLVRLCFYGNAVSGKQIHVGKDLEPTITVDRTSWLDLSLGRFRQKDMISLPFDIDSEYRKHLKALVRITRKDRNGIPVARYECDASGEDHYAHARNYAELALPFAISHGRTQDIIE